MSLKISADRRIKARKKRKLKEKSTLKFSMDRILNSFPIFQCRMCQGRFEYKSDYYDHDCPKWEDYKKDGTQGVESEVPVFKIPKLPKKIEETKLKILEKLKVDAERIKIEAEKAKIVEEKAKIELEKSKMEEQKKKIEAAIKKSSSCINSMPKVVIYPNIFQGKKNYANLIKTFTEIENQSKMSMTNDQETLVPAKPPSKLLHCSTKPPNYLSKPPPPYSSKPTSYLSKPQTLFMAKSTPYLAQTTPSLAKSIPFSAKLVPFAQNQPPKPTTLCLVKSVPCAVKSSPCLAKQLQAPPGSLTQLPNGNPNYTRLFELLTDGIKRKRCFLHREDNSNETKRQKNFGDDVIIEKPKISFSIDSILGIEKQN